MACRIVPATEISAVDGEFEDLHILGYGIDHHDPVLASRLLDARGDRERRAEAMAARLPTSASRSTPPRSRRGARRASRWDAPTWPRRCWPTPRTPSGSSARATHDVSSFIPAYLIQGTPGYVARTHPTVSEAIRWIHDAGGVAVWAHPFWDISDDAGVLAAIDRYHGAGLDGVEAFYVTHTPEQTALVAGRCRELGLLSTGSSDYHGPDHRLFSRFQAFELHGLEPELGPIAEAARLASRARARGLRLAHRPVRLGEVHRGHARRAHAEGTRPPGGADRRGRDPRGPVLRPGLHARGPRHKRAPDRVRGRHLSRNGVVAIVAAISPYRQAREEARVRMGDRFVEVHVRASVEECERRDVKGLYERARAGEIQSFTGVSDPYEEPHAAELTLDTAGESPQHSAARVVELVESRLSSGEPGRFVAG